MVGGLVGGAVAAGLEWYRTGDWNRVWKAGIGGLVGGAIGGVLPLGGRWSKELIRLARTPRVPGQAVAPIDWLSARTVGLSNPEAWVAGIGAAAGFGLNQFIGDRRPTGPSSLPTIVIGDVSKGVGHLKPGEPDFMDPGITSTPVFPTGGRPKMAYLTMPAMRGTVPFPYPKKNYYHLDLEKNIAVDLPNFLCEYWRGLGENSDQPPPEEKPLPPAVFDSSRSLGLAAKEWDNRRAALESTLQRLDTADREFRSKVPEVSKYHERARISINKIINHASMKGRVPAQGGMTQNDYILTYLNEAYNQGIASFEETKRNNQDLGRDLKPPPAVLPPPAGGNQVPDWLKQLLEEHKRDQTVINNPNVPNRDQAVQEQNREATRLRQELDAEKQRLAQAAAAKERELERAARALEQQGQAQQHKLDQQGAALQRQQDQAAQGAQGAQPAVRPQAAGYPAGGLGNGLGGGFGGFDPMQMMMMQMMMREMSGRDHQDNPRLASLQRDNDRLRDQLRQRQQPQPPPGPVAPM
ncbi:MAG: hypothetical protein HOQ24_02020, partial [Mycobacteriaceae bacterium]|nr:hypothetical protein [Mycobacteriaceae bacterium]